MGLYRPFGSDDPECEACAYSTYEIGELKKERKALQLALYHAVMGETLTDDDLAVINALPEGGG